MPRFEEWEKNHGYDLSSDSSSDSGEESDKDKEKGMLIARLVYAFHFTAGNKNVYPQWGVHVRWKILMKDNLNLKNIVVLKHCCTLLHVSNDDNRV